MATAEKNAIIIGATSGIGKALAELLISNGYRVGVTGRRSELLDEFAQKHGGNAVCRKMDVDAPEEARAGLTELIEKLGNVELIILSAGTGFPNSGLEWGPSFAPSALTWKIFSWLILSGMTSVSS